MTEFAPHEWDQLQAIVRAAAKDAIRKWPNSLESDDVEQDVMVILMESPGTARKILSENPPIQHKLALKLCHREAGKEMTEYEHFSGQYTYDTDIVRALLDEDVLTEDVEGFREDIIDLMDALERMTWEKSAYVDPLLKRYADGEVPHWQDTATHNRISRGIESLTEHMNRNRRARVANYSGPGSRRALSNSQAFTATTVGWQGDYSDGRR